MAKVIVLCVDRDDDLGQKTGIKGPVIGVENNLKAATALLQADPTESDANAMFEAINVYKGLKKEGVEIVTLTGHRARGYKADRAILVQLDKVLKKHKADGVFLVTDGSDDEQVIPVIHSRIKILSKKTLIVRQAKELEKSYYVLKQLMRDPTFARIIFGLPGVILLTIAFLQELGFKIIMLAIGIYLILKGFGIEDPILEAFRNFRESTSIERASFPLYIGSVIVFLLSLWAGFEQLTTYVGTDLIKQAAIFTSGFISLFIVAVVLFMLGRIGDMQYKKEIIAIRKYLLSIVTILAIWLVISKVIDLIFGTILLDVFIGWVIFAFIISVVGLSIVRNLFLKKYIIKRLKTGLEVFNAEGNKIGKISSVNKKRKRIIVEGKKKEKLSIPFSKIHLAQEDFVSVRI